MENDTTGKQITEEISNDEAQRLKIELERAQKQILEKDSKIEALQKRIDQLELVNQDLLFQIASLQPPKPPRVLSFESIPLELKKHIFSFLETEDLLRSSSVCKDWHLLSNHPSLWKLRFEQDQYIWKAYASLNRTKRDDSFFKRWAPSVFDFLKQQNGPSIRISKDNWKELFLNEFYLNKSMTTTSSSSSSELQDAISKPKKSRGFFGSQNQQPLVIPVLGEGNIVSAKTFIKKMMWTDKSPRTNLYPGVEGIGSGVGFQIRGVELNLVAVYQGDRKVFNQVRTAWQNFFKSASAFILVLDTPDTSSVKKELEQYIQDGFLLPEVPILVCVCFTPPSNFSLPILSKQLGFDENSNRSWCLRVVDVVDDKLDGLWSSLGWLVDKAGV